MALTSWKSFNFFEVEEAKLPANGDKTSPIQSSEFSCLCTGSENLFLGCSDGKIHILSSAFKVVRTFETHAHGSVTHLKQVDGTALLVSVSEDLLNEPELKVWALDRTEKKTGTPKCLSTVAVQNGRQQFPISCFAALDNLSQLAVGFANGSVTVIRGDLINDRGTKQRTIFQSDEPITGVEFRQGSTTTLYIATTARILTLIISGKGQGQPAKNLDDTGCGVGCMTVDHTTGDVLIARDDAVYSYGAGGRGPSYAYEGPKQLLEMFENYVVLVARPKAAPPQSKNILRRFVGGQSQDLYNMPTFAILDTDLKYIAHTEILSSQVKAVFKNWGDLFIMTLEGKVVRYHEKSLSKNLEILYQRDLYVLAINLAQRAGVSAKQRNVILRKYGDYLHRKGDYDTAMQQYLKAIDSTEPSQVIRKYLDSQRINNLIEYLEELHDHGKATVDHTTLLLNCYAKLKDTEKLETFIKSGNNFDLETAISMCRQGGYYDQAVFLAKKHGEHELVVDILIENSKKYKEALDYIWRLPPGSAYPNMMKYAHVLLEHCPNDTTQIFVDYYMGRYQPKRDAPITEPFQAGAPSAVQNLASFIPLPYMQANIASSPADTGNITLSESDQAAAEAAAPPAPNYNVPRPRTAFASFADHPAQFIIFLEAYLKQKDIDKQSRVDIHTTLFEMYLETAASKKGQEKRVWEGKAKTLLEGEDIPIDTSNVLLLSHLTKFKEGTTLVREQQGLRFDIFRSYASANDTQGAIKALRKYGSEEPRLYPAALAYFTSDSKILSEAGSEVTRVLKKIDEDGLMAPLQIIQTLSTNGVATMGLVKSYLSLTIEREQKEISNNQRLIESYRTETDSKRKELSDLETRPTVFQTRRCSACGGSLDLPTVHFMCKHSFHQRCLNQMDDDDAECPQCAPMNSNIRAFRKAQIDSADRHEIFQDALQRSRDRFGTISEFFGRGVMSIPGGM